MDQIQRTRQFVLQLFQDMMAEHPGALSETAMIRDGHYCGHRFRHDDLTAVWFFEESELKIYQGDTLMRVESTISQPYEHRKAA